MQDWILSLQDWLNITGQVKGAMLFVQKVSSCIKHYGILCYGVSRYFTIERVTGGDKRLLFYAWEILLSLVYQIFLRININ